MLLIITCCPTGSIGPNSSLAVVGPSTTTGVAAALSASVKKRPDDNVRARTVSHDAVVPVIDVVQFVLPFVNACELLRVGATARMSGAAILDASAVASLMVSVEAEPRPPRTPDEFVDDPGVTISRLLPSAAI